MNDALKRAFRTFIQNTIPALTAFFSAVAAKEFFGVKDDLKVLGIAAFVAGGGALVSYLQNLFEDKTGTEVLPK